jgi:hypothetical protein
MLVIKSFVRINHSVQQPNLGALRTSTRDALAFCSLGNDAKVANTSGKRTGILGSQD